MLVLDRDCLDFDWRLFDLRIFMLIFLEVVALGRFYAQKINQINVVDEIMQFSTETLWLVVFYAYVLVPIRCTLF